MHRTENIYTGISLAIVIVISLTAIGSTDPGTSSLWDRETLTHGLGGHVDKAAESGVDVAIGITEIYQHKLDGGSSGNTDHGRHTGSYDVELEFDIDRLLGWKNAFLYVHAEGSWPRNDLDSSSVGSIMGINGDAAGNRTVDVTEVWIEQTLLSDMLLIRAGKLDITGGFVCQGCPVTFDGSLFANDETTQFLNGAMVNNPTIPFPAQGLGAILHFNPGGSWYASIGVADALADPRQTGFRTTFGGGNEQFYVAETGITPILDSADGKLMGAYRIGVWCETFAEEMGFYFTCDQMLTKENPDPEDTQGLGVFARYGHTDEQTYDIETFWSIGCQYQGLFEGRDNDILALGYATGDFSAIAGYTADESILECYYNILLAPWISVSPIFQYVSRPGGDVTINDVTVLGIRAQIAL